MMTRHQERTLRSICVNGGNVTLPGKRGPITVEVTLAYAGRADATITYPGRADATITYPGRADATITYPGRADATITYPGRADATITYPGGVWSRLNDWATSDMYLEISERLDADMETAQ